MRSPFFLRERKVRQKELSNSGTGMIQDVEAEKEKSGPVGGRNREGGSVLDARAKPDVPRALPPLTKPHTKQ